VLFLADGMIDEAPNDDEFGSSQIPADGPPADVMQAMLA
jgi:hypothetical protein